MKLAQLVQMLRGDRSYEQLQADCGGHPSAQRLQQIATTDLKAFPNPDTLTALAQGLAVPVHTVVLAAAESLGAPVEDEAFLGKVLPPQTANLSDEQVAAVRAVIVAMNPPARDKDGRLLTPESGPTGHRVRPGDRPAAADGEQKRSAGQPTRSRQSKRRDGGRGR